MRIYQYRRYPIGFLSNDPWTKIQSPGCDIMTDGRFRKYQGSAYATMANKILTKIGL